MCIKLQMNFHHLMLDPSKTLSPMDRQHGKIDPNPSCPVVARRAESDEFTKGMSGKCCVHYDSGFKIGSFAACLAMSIKV